MEENLNLLRKQIDTINYQLLKLLNERVQIALQIAELKLQSGILFFAPERERKMLEELVTSNQGPLTSEMVKNIFQEIFRLSRECMEQKKSSKLLESWK